MLKAKILVVDDEKLSRVTLARQLQNQEYETEAYENPYQAMERIAVCDWDVVISDMRMPGMDGLQFLKEVKKQSPDTMVILITGYGTVESAVEAMKEGAFDYVTKPFKFEEMSVRLEKALAYRALIKETVELRRRLELQEKYHAMVGKSPAMRSAFEKIEILADNVCSVLIRGETGTGKELVAEALHAKSPRRDGPLVKVSCSALSRDIVESELFGHEKGAFTGAIQQKRGRFELAHGGTIFLDDIEDVPIEYQTKLLRVLQEKQFERVGGEEAISVDVRVVSATKKDLHQLAKEGKFREDLLYRILGAQIDIPPLRERQEDIPLIISHFLGKYGSNREGLQFSTESLRVLLDYHWPGNVRELEHVVEQAVALCQDTVIHERHLPSYLTQSIDDKRVVSLHLHGRESVNLPEILQHAEERLIEWAMKRSRGNQAHAAEILSIPRTTLRQKMTKANSNEERDRHEEKS